jgi:hypothetical protein
MLHRFPYRPNSGLLRECLNPGQWWAMRVLTFVPVQGANFSFRATLLEKQGLVFGAQE